MYVFLYPATSQIPGEPAPRRGGENRGRAGFPWAARQAGSAAAAAGGMGRPAEAHIPGLRNQGKAFLNHTYDTFHSVMAGEMGETLNPKPAEDDTPGLRAIRVGSAWSCQYHAGPSHWNMHSLQHQHSRSSRQKQLGSCGRTHLRHQRSVAH